MQRSLRECILKANEKQTLLIDGLVGKIEVKLVEPEKKKNAWVVICHPHPSFGGTMNNKVVTTLQKSFQAIGYGTVLFNFRGVGRSVGEYNGGEGEQEDLVVVVDWLKDNFVVDKTILAGFSFGGYVALKKASALQIDGLCIVAPAVGMYDFSQINIDFDWTLIQGGEDEVVCEKEVLNWARKQPTIPDIYWKSGGSHFFHRQLIWLKGVIQIAF